MNKQSSLVGRYRQLRKSLIHFKEALITTIDMSWGFYQLPMEPKSQNYTAFSRRFGSFKWLRMPMELTGSPNTFQSLMERACWTHVEHYRTLIR